MKLDPPAIVIGEHDELVKAAKAARAQAEAAEEKGSPHRWREAGIYAELADKGWSVRKIADACGTNKDTVSRFIQCVGLCLPRETAFWDAYQQVRTDKAEKTAHVSNNSGNNEWYTPAEYIEAARSVLVTIDLDPASSVLAQETVQANAFYTKSDDGLSKRWQGNVWLNPPYATELIGRFVDKLCEHIQTKDVQSAILLVNNATETEWFQEAAKHCTAICFPESRVKFLSPEGKPGAPLQGQAILYFGEASDGFAQKFSQFGSCATWKAR